MGLDRNSSNKSQLRPVITDFLPRARQSHHHPSAPLPPTPAPKPQDSAPTPIVEPQTLAPKLPAQPEPEASKPVAPPAMPQESIEKPVDTREPQPISEQKSILGTPKKWNKKLPLLISALVFVVLLGLVGYLVGNYWYNSGLAAVTEDKDAEHVRVTIPKGSTPEMIAALLKSKNLIRDPLVFLLYTREQNVQGKLQAGTFLLSPSYTIPMIVEHLLSAKSDEFSLTFLPGETVAGHKKVLENAGYKSDEINAAFAKTYDSPIFASKPAGTDLEGYVYGETYNFFKGAPVEEILTRTFDELNKQITANDLVAAYQKQGLSLYEGITLASIIEREVMTDSDRKQVAQVFLKRLNEGFPLGADATFVYAAKKVGKTPSVDFDSPYNTRIHAGLPPGPISSPGLSSLLAVASPADGDYLYFVSGDDGTTHFSRTDAEHQALTRQFCIKNCSLF